MSLRSFREKVNILLYDSKPKMLRLLRYLNLIISFIAIGTLLYFYGFPQSPMSKAILLGIIKASFVFYISRYLIQLLYDFQPKQFLKRSWVEAVINGLLIIEGISYNFFGDLLITSLFVRSGLSHFADYSAIFIQVYFLFAVLAELTRSGGIVPNIRIHPSSLFLISFALLIIFGTGLLMMPEMTVQRGSMGFVNALFTSTSASCVTGLIVVDTATFFTFKGQMVILMLFKLGGLNIIAFGTFFAIGSKVGIGLQQHEVIEDFVNKDSVLKSEGLLSKVIIGSLLIEAIGAILLFFLWTKDTTFNGSGGKFFHSIFHSMSAFNNAGFSTFTNGLNESGVKNQYLIHSVIMVLIFIGGLGFMALFDIFGISKLRERMRYPWKQLEFSTKIALYFSLGLVAFGAVFFFLLEFNNTIAGRSTAEAVVTSLFQSITTRTAGFNTVDINSLALPMLILIIFLMLIGGSSSSTAGGIKTSSFGIIWASAIATMRTKKNVELFKRTISQNLILKAFSIFLFSVVGIFMGVFLLSITDANILQQGDRSLFDLIFEEVSAFSTVGLSTGITSELSDAGKVIIIVSMYVGRVGMLTVAFFFGRKPISTDYKYPYGYTMIG